MRAADAEADLDRRFAAEVRPFLEAYCVSCHDDASREADLDLSAFDTLEAVAKDHPRWALVLERLRDGDMPPRKAKKQPPPESRSAVIAWIETLRETEARRTAGDPGPVPARRLSNSEYDRTIHEITGVDLRPTRDFPVDPANQAGFDNSAESLAMSPALVKKYLQAARTVSEHLVLTPDGFAFAPHPVVADTDRDKWAVLRIVEFYRRQPTDYADYFEAAWRFKHRSQLGTPGASLAEVAAQSGVSAKYLATIWAVLEEERWEVGPMADLQVRWRRLPPPGEGAGPEVRDACEAVRDSIVQLRSRLVPEVKNLTARPIQEGSQTLVMWKNRQMAANRRRYDPAALISASAEGTNAPPPAPPPTSPKPSSALTTNAAPARRGTNRVQAPTPGIVQRGGLSLPPAILTTGTSATAQMAGARRGVPVAELVVPDDPAGRARYEAAFSRFAEVFPDAFYITERARVYLDAEKEQENAGRLLSAGLHSMTGYFRDDRPLYDLILDEAAQRELDRLWEEFDLVSSVPQRMHTSFVWFERTDSVFLRDAEFDPYRPEDKSVTSQEKIRSLAELYLAKARRNQASETVQQAIQEHFDLVAANMARVERARATAEPLHRAALEAFAARAYRRPLTAAEHDELAEFSRRSREENGVDHEEAMRDGVARVLMSPSFLFRMDLVDASSPGSTGTTDAAAGPAAVALSDHALASRLSYFLWNGPPDEPLQSAAAAGQLRHPDGIRTQARRLLKDPRARNFATEFAGQWLDIRRFEEHNGVDRERFPAFNNELRTALFEEPIRLFTDVLQRDRPALDLLYTHNTFVNGVLARHYGMPPEMAPEDGWTQVSDARSYGRGGLVPMGVFLTANSPGLRTSPVKRGYWVVRRLLGERIPPPPATVPELPSDEKQLGELTLRETLARHRRDEACAGCHARFDSFGLVFEGYGPVGERRSVDLGGRPVDTAAEFPDGSSRTGLEGLLEYVRAHREQDFVDNLCRKLLAYGLGRTLILSDEPLVSAMKQRLADGDGRFGVLIESVVTSPQFLHTRGRGDLARQ